MNSAARDAIFDLAINRAASFLRGAGQHASRVELELIRTVLEQRPTEGEWHWAGGESGVWQIGKAPTP
jgi:hypothetical protein